MKITKKTKGILIAVGISLILGLTYISADKYPKVGSMNKQIKVCVDPPNE